MKLNIYDSKGNVVKECEANALDLEFGTIRTLMELLNIENVDDTFELLKTIYGAWDQVISILGKVFPDITYEEWEHVIVKELLPVVIDIFKYSFSEMLSIPTDSKN